MQPSMKSCGGPSPQKPAVPPGAQPAWMVHAETQTCSSSQAPLWADEQFAFLELSRPPGHARDEEVCVQPHAQQRTWSKVQVRFAAVSVPSLGVKDQLQTWTDRAKQYEPDGERGSQVHDDV